MDAPPQGKQSLSAESAVESASPVPGRTSLRLRRGLAAAVVAAAFFGALAQPPATWSSRRAPGPLAWLLQPVDHSGFPRIPAVTSQLRALALIPGTRSLRAVGDGGVVLASDDRGASWHRDTAAERALAAPGVVHGSPEGTVAPPSPAPSAADGAAPVGPGGLRLGRGPGGQGGGRGPGAAGGLPQSDPRTAAMRGRLERKLMDAQRERDSLRALVKNSSALAPPTALKVVPYQRQTPRQDVGAALSRAEARVNAIQDSLAALPSPRAPERIQQPVTPPASGTSSDSTGAPAAAPEGAAVALRDVFFADSLHGWIVGRPGRVARTEDGGRTWSRADTGPRDDLTFVYFGDAGHGFVVTARGEVIATRTGGQTWQPVELPAAVTGAGYVPGLGAWVEMGAVSYTTPGLWAQVGYATADPGRIPPASSDLRFSPREGYTRRSGGFGGSGPAPRVTRYLDARRGWTFTADSTLVTRDGGRSWSPDTILWGAGAADVTFDGGSGWAVGDGVLASHDAGRSWRRSLVRRQLAAIHFRDGRAGWAVGDDGLVLSTTDGGGHWRARASGLREDLVGVAFRGDSGMVLGAAGGTAVTGDAGRTWRARPSPPPDDALAGLGAGWMPPAHGGRWSADVTVRGRRFASASVRSDGRGLAVGVDSAAGRLLATRDSGRTWTALPDTAGRLFESVSRAGGDTAYAVRSDGGLYESLDGGITWEPRNSGRGPVMPAPWFYVVLVLAALPLVPRRRAPRPQIDSIEGVLVSDRPLIKPTEDRLNFRPLAEALSRFLRNTRTEPPLTIAVTGKWGTGKTSLMGILGADLRRFGIRTVWFNAWHHQTEEHLLASLLEAIRRDAVPPPWRPGGLRFRARLLRIRWPALVIATPLFLGALGLLVGRGSAGDLWQLALEVSRRLGALLELTPAAPPADEVQGPVGTSVLALVFAVLGLALTYLKGFRAFGVRPSRLLAGAARAARVKDLEAHAGFRYQFAREFGEVTRALNARSRRLVIVVDDLDRCRPENVLEVLEAVNFLVSSGECFVLLGIDKEQVEAAIGLAFDDMATELAAQREIRDGGTAGGKPAAIRMEYADAYLQKLINFQVPIPTAEAAGFATLLAAEAPPPPPPRAAAWRRSRELLRRYAPAATAAAVLLLGFTVGHRTRPPRGQRGETPAAVAAATRPADAVEIAAPAAAPVSPANAAPAAPTPNRRRSEPGVFVGVAAPRDLRSGIGLLALFALAGALVAVAVATRRPDPTVHDSPDFLRALAAWAPVVQAHVGTPRGAKRFLNDVRFLAMRQRIGDGPAPPRRTWWTRLRARFHVAGKSTTGPAREAPARTDPSAIPEHVLVALSVFRLCRGDAGRPSQRPSPAEVREALGAAAANPAVREPGGLDALESDSDLAAHVDRFLEITADLG